MNDIVNPFDVSAKKGGYDLSTQNVDVEVQRAVAEVQASVIMAKRYPRDQRKACESILMSCERPSLAQKAIYAYARGGTEIKGASIRLAEAIGQSWGNLSAGWKTVSSTQKESLIKAFAWDIETNNRKELEFVVPHSRYTKSKGNTLLTDPRDIYEICANQASRRVRACILSLIPADVVEMAVEQCNKTMLLTEKTDKETIGKMVDALSQFGVTRKMIEKMIQRSLDAVTPANMVRLRQIYQSLRDGVGAVSDFFEEETTIEGEQIVKVSKSAPKVEEATVEEVKPEPVQAKAPVPQPKPAPQQTMLDDSIPELDTPDANGETFDPLVGEAQRIIDSFAVRLTIEEIDFVLRSEKIRQIEAKYPPLFVDILAKASERKDELRASL